MSGCVERQDRVRGAAGEQRARALARGSAARASAVAGSRRRQPEAAPAASGCARQAQRAEQRRRAARAASRDERRDRRAVGAAVRAEAAAVPSSERSSITAVPSSSGCASGAGGWTHSSPCSRERQRRGRTASSRPAGGPPSRRRARSRAASARPSACRRPIVSARLEHAHRHGRPARARSPPRARSGPEPTTTASGKPLPELRGQRARVHVRQRLDRDHRVHA